MGKLPQAMGESPQLTQSITSLIACRAKKVGFARQARSFLAGMYGAGAESGVQQRAESAETGSPLSVLARHAPRLTRNARVHSSRPV